MRLRVLELEREVYSLEESHRVIAQQQQGGIFSILVSIYLYIQQGGIFSDLVSLYPSIFIFYRVDYADSFEEIIFFR